MNKEGSVLSWLDIRPGEGRATSLLLSHSFFMGVSTVFFETAASALFLAHFTGATLPYVYLTASAVSILAGLVYNRLKERVPFAVLMLGTLALLLAMVSLLRLGLGITEALWLFFLLMVAYRLLSILTDLEYWAVATRLYDVRQSKRLFSLIGSGEVTARILGSFSVPVLVLSIGVPNLIWVSAAGLAACVALLVTLFRCFPALAGTSNEGTGAEKSVSSDGSLKSLYRLFQDRYLKLVFALAFVAVLGKYFVDFAFLTQMQTRLHDVERLATFFALFSGVTQAVNLLVRLFVSGKLLGRYGVRVGLLVLPVSHVVLTTAIVVVASVPIPVAVFWLVISNQGLYKTVKHPVDNPSFKVLYQPLPKRKRLAAQIAVEVILTPIAIGLAAAIMLTFRPSGLQSVSFLHYVMLASFGVWIPLAVFTFREYGAALLKALQKRTIDRMSFSFEDEESLQLVRSQLESERAPDVLFALDLLEKAEHRSYDSDLIRLVGHPSADVRRHVLLLIEGRKSTGASKAVARCVERETVPAVRAAALRALCALDDASVEQVVAHLGEDDLVVRRGALIGLLRKPRREALGAVAAVRRLLRSPSPAERTLACEVIAESSWSDSSLVAPVLRDDNPRVRIAALRAAGDVVFRYAPTGEGATGPWEFLAGRTGYVQADAASVFDRVFNGTVASAEEVGCWAHARRRLVALKDMDCRVAYPLKLIARMYRIERLADARELSVDERTLLRKERSAIWESAKSSASWPCSIRSPGPPPWKRWRTRFSSAWTGIHFSS